jgi:hypothetical protein
MPVYPPHMCVCVCDVPVEAGVWCVFVFVFGFVAFVCLCFAFLFCVCVCVFKQDILMWIHVTKILIGTWLLFFVLCSLFLLFSS